MAIAGTDSEGMQVRVREVVVDHASEAHPEHVKEAERDFKTWRRK